MTELLLQFGLSNAAFSLLLAIIALVTGLILRRPQLTYLLWLLVFIKLLTPPVMSIPVAPALWQSAAGSVAQIRLAEPSFNQPDASSLGSLVGPPPLTEYGFEDTRPAYRSPNWLAVVKAWLPLGLLAGSLLALIWSAVHILSFHRRLTTEVEPAPPEIQATTAEIAQRLNLHSVPQVHITAAHMSPLVWWLKGQLAIVIPAPLLKQLDHQQWQLVLAHELAHIRRRDYLVRWLEWLTCLTFWWNPVVWWAQRHLRATEEICCDALVLTCLKPQPRSYARSLLTVVEFLAYPALRPPALASEISSGGLFLRRCRMIVSENANRKTTRWMQALVILFALIVLPLGAHLYAKEKAETKSDKAATMKSDKEAAGKEKLSQEEYLKQVWVGLQEKVEAGKLSEGEAEAKFEEIKMAHHMSACEGACLKAELKAVQAKLEAELAAGNITKAEADSELAEAEQSIKEQQLAQQETYQALVKAWDRSETLINEGMATFEEAVREYEQAKQQFLTENDIFASASMYYQDAVAEYQAAIRAGNMSHAEAFTRLSAAEMGIFAKEFLKAEQQYHEQAVWASLQAAVARGEISQEDAEAKLQAYLQESEVKAGTSSKEAKEEQKDKEEKKLASAGTQATDEQKNADEEKKKQAMKEQDSKK